ncbi:MAG: AdoMet-dependent rRNA methyltransferase spb1 [Geoglossum umbratile]|nr:MAG: AdoMet-dependent rRNA methyltransferase spb1 [Geoglossum umbratile]
MGLQKKHGKGRLDKWYKLAKEKGYRARAAFKLIQLNKKYNFLEKSRVLIDLCAAPGSWCQVAAEAMPANSLIIGVDLAPIKSIPRTITFQSDITTDKCRATIRQHLKTWRADTVLHDGAPNVGTAWVQDAFTQAELALQAMKLATEFLVEGGTFVTKVFRSKDYNSLMWVFNQLFTKVEATKPPASRNVSAEIFVVCRGFKAPKRIDPKFLDPRSVFAELADPTPNNEAKVFNPEVKKRKRDGYAEGDYTQFKEAPVVDFIQTTDPIAMLGGLNKLSFEHKRNGDIALAALEKLPETTREIQDCCADLKVLGRKEFRSLLKWRLKMRENFGLASIKAPAGQKNESGEVVEVAPMDEELRIQEELQRLDEQESGRKKRERRKENERKQKEIVRMQLHMTAPMEIGLEQSGPKGEDTMFTLKMVDKAGAVDKVVKGKMNVIVTQEDRNKGREGGTDRKMNDRLESEDQGWDTDEDVLERELDSMYERYRERRLDADAKYRAKKARKEHEDGEWEGLSEKSESSDDGAVLDSSNEDSSDEEELDNRNKPLITTLATNEIQESGLTKQAAIFFDQEIFKGISGLDESIKYMSTENAGPNSAEPVDLLEDTKNGHAPNGKPIGPKAKSLRKTAELGITRGTTCEDTSFELVERSEEGEWQESHGPLRDGQSDIDIITAEAMTLAQRIASGERTKYDLIDEGFNKYAFRDKDGLPEWFLDDENKHSKPHRPITAAGASAIKEKLRALNARPIKKVREAKDRKKFKAAQRLEKLRKKSALLADDEGMTEKEKASSIAKIMSKAAKKPKQQVKVVVARGGNKGISGRPRGVKGKYKIVDARLKKDVRAEKRLAKKRK